MKNENHALSANSVSAACLCGKWRYDKTSPETSDWHVQVQHRKHVEQVSREELHELAKKIAPLIGYEYTRGGWPGSLVDGELRDSAHIHRIENGAVVGALFIGYCGWQDTSRLNISISWPVGRNGQSHTLSNYARGSFKTSISVSAHKTPEQIAKDIKRRLLSNTEALYQKAAENMNREHVFRDKKVEAIKAVAALTGYKYDLRPQDLDGIASPSYYFKLGGDSTGGEVAVHSAENLQVKIDAKSVDEVKKIVEFAKSLR